MKVAVPREISPGERRVALTPDAAAALVKGGLEVLVETGAGDGAFHADAAFEKAGARIAPDAGALYGQADVVLKVQKPALDEVDRLREGTVLVSFLQALTSPDLVQRLAARRITSFGMEGIPRISRAQKMDALSSQANIAGYKAVLIAAESLAEVLPDADDGRRHRLRRPRARDRRGRGRTAGDRHRAPARRAGVGLRRAGRR